MEVRGSRSRRSSRDLSAASTVFREGELSAPGAAATDVLRWAPGLEVSRSGSRAERATLSLRGSTAAQVPVYLGPFRLNDEITGAADLSALPLWVLDRVEVFRGASPTALGSFGLGGAVVLSPRLPKQRQLRLAAGVGSYGEAWQSAAVSVASGDAGRGGVRRGGSVDSHHDEVSSDALVAYRHAAADNDFPYLDDGGTAFDPQDDRERVRDNADHRDHELWAIGVTRLPGGGRVLSVLNGLTRERGVSGLGVVPARRARSATERLLAGVSGRAPCGDERGAGACAVELSTSLQLGREHVTDPLSEIGIGQVPAHHQSLRLTQQGKLMQRLGPLHAVALLEVSRDSLSLVQREREEALRTSLRPALEGTLELGADVSLLAAGGLSAVATDGDRGTPEDSLTPEGRLGARWQLGAVTLRANVGHYSRHATLGELYGLSALVRGNAALSAERGESADAGVTVLTQITERLTLEASALGFARASRELIAYRRSTFGVVTPFNVGRAEVLGAEGALSLNYGAWLTFEANMALQEPRDVTPNRAITNDLLPYHSRLVAGARTWLRAPAWGHLPSMQLGLSAHHRTSRFADPAGLLVIPAQTTLDLEWLAALWSEHLQLSLAARNLLAEAQYDLLGQPLPGRTYHGALEWVW